MVHAEDVLRILLENAGPGRSSCLPLQSVSGLVLAADLLSDTDIPCADSASCDGFAVAGDELRFEIASSDLSREPASGVLAFPVSEGDPVPRGTDRVVPAEGARVEETVLYLEASPPSGANIIRRGDVAGEGRLMVEAGTRLSQQHVGVAALCGREVLEVYTRPATAVISVGDRLVPPTWRTAPGRSRDPVMPLLRAQLSCSGFSPAICITASGERSRLQAAMRQAISCCDVLLLSGHGDTASLLLEDMGYDMLFRSVAQHPAGDLACATGTGNGTVRVFLLPSDPLAAMVATEEYVLPSLRRLSGFKGCRKRVYTGETTFEYAKEPGMLHFIGVLAYREGNSWKLHRPELSSSSVLPGTISVNALALVAPDTLGFGMDEQLPFHFLCSTAGELSFA